MIATITTLCVMAFAPSNFKAPLSVWHCDGVGYIPSRDTLHRTLEVGKFYPFEIVIQDDGAKKIILIKKQSDS